MEHQDEKQPLQRKNDYGTSPSRYNDIVDYKQSSTVPTGTSGIGAKKFPVDE